MKKSKNYVWGALILTVGSLISKFLGIFFKIPLTNIMGDYGMGLYGYAYPLYVTFLTVSTAGLPSAVSKMVAESVSGENHRQAYRIFWIAFFTLAVLGISSSAVMFFSAQWFIDTFNWDPLAYRSIIALSIAPFFVCLISVVRGFFQGMQMMVYTSVSEILEQVGRVGVGVSLAVFWFRTRGVEWGAAGATFPDVRTGLRAQVQHLKAYASTEDWRTRWLTRASTWSQADAPPPSSTWAAAGPSPATPTVTPSCATWRTCTLSPTTSESGPRAPTHCAQSIGAFAMTSGER